jgi:hypothetical protein
VLYVINPHDLGETEDKEAEEGEEGDEEDGNIVIILINIHLKLRTNLYIIVFSKYASIICYFELIIKLLFIEQKIIF